MARRHQLSTLMDYREAHVDLLYLVSEFACLMSANELTGVSPCFVTTHSLVMRLARQNNNPEPTEIL